MSKYWKKIKNTDKKLVKNGVITVTSKDSVQKVTPPQAPPTPGNPELPNTGVEDLSLVFNAASISLLAGLGLLTAGKKKEGEEE